MFLQSYKHAHTCIDSDTTQPFNSKRPFYMFQMPFTKLNFLHVLHVHLHLCHLKYVQLEI